MLPLLLLLSISPENAAAEVDRLVRVEHAALEVTAPARVSDERLYRRLSLDVAGQVPSVVEADLFATIPGDDKVAAAADDLLAAESYGRRWARYWSAVIFSRATSTRNLTQNRRDLEDWLADEINAGRGWDAIVSELLTATGDSKTQPRTAFIVAHAGETEEIASEAARVFMGVQIGCAQCHDHPFDRWTRNEFHEFAAFFPRIQMIPKRDMGITFNVVSHNGRPRPTPEQLFAVIDRNGDRVLTRSEASGIGRQVFGYLLRRGDTNDDGRITFEEAMATPPPPITTGQGSAEHQMPSLDDPTAEGVVMTPRLFSTGAAITAGTSDLERRLSVSAFLTDPENVWFARSVVNRYWDELLGEGFYVPVDDLGPDREPVLPEVVDLLAEGFVDSGYDLRWLVATIVQTESYARERSAEFDDLALAGTGGATPQRLPGDQVFDRLEQTLGIEPSTRRRGVSEREFVGELFGGDPSVAIGDQPVGIPQALFLMNASGLEQLLDTRGTGRIGQIVRESRTPTEAVETIYETILGRLPTEAERRILKKSLARSRSLDEGLEDIAWALVNSAEFLTRD